MEASGSHVSSDLCTKYASLIAVPVFSLVLAVETLPVTLNKFHDEISLLVVHCGFQHWLAVVKDYTARFQDFQVVELCLSQPRIYLGECFMGT